MYRLQAEESIGCCYGEAKDELVSELKGSLLQSGVHAGVSKDILL